MSVKLYSSSVKEMVPLTSLYVPAADMGVQILTIC